MAAQMEALYQRLLVEPGIRGLMQLLSTVSQLQSSDTRPSIHPHDKRENQDEVRDAGNRPASNPHPLALQIEFQFHTINHCPDR